LLDGIFSFALLDTRKNKVIVARDHVGITTLYHGIRSSDGSHWFASEMKSLSENCDKITSFPPGYYFTNGQYKKYYQPAWYSPSYVSPVIDEASIYKTLRKALEDAVIRQLMSEVPYGVLLSGGLDSSLIASIASRAQKMLDSSGSKQDLVHPAPHWSRLHSFSIGLPGSPDLIAAQQAADFLGTVHHNLTFTIQEGLDAIEEVIYHLETYDVTTVRASTPMYLLSRKIKAYGVKMVLSGEGSDEIFGGYLYFHNAPDAQSLQNECVGRIQNLHTSDCLRANKATMAWGLEARVPFLDKTFLDVAMAIPPEHKLTRKPPHNHTMEKYVLRKAFEDTENPYLPDSILWRQKEQFSDGVGYSWIDQLKAHAEGFVTNEAFEKRFDLFPKDTPTTKEAFWYRTIFEKLFPQKQCLETVVRWIPRRDWGKTLCEILIVY
jgi:asparagine synthase (glutamine-hydrolysing)